MLEAQVALAQYTYQFGVKNVRTIAILKIRRKW